MKTRLNLTAMVVALLTLASLGNLTAQSFGTSKAVYKKAVVNMEKAIKSDNDGVKKNAIYFAGKYKVVETVDELVSQLRRENDANIRVLIALSLNEIGTEDALKAVRTLAAEDRNERVKHISKAIVLENKSLFNELASVE